MLQIKATINIEEVYRKATITVGSDTSENSVALENSYYTGEELADEDGNFTEKYVITFNEINSSNYFIVFDKENNRHPNTITVDGTVITDITAELKVSFDNSEETHTIEIDNWNTPNNPLIITGIYTVKNLEITKKNLESFSSDIMDRQSEEYPTYGLISNSASLSFYDFYENALDLIVTKVLHSGVKVKALIADDETDVSEQVCEMEIRELSYDNENHKVNITMKDNLEDMQNINVASIDYDPQKPQIQTAQWYYEYLYNITKDTGKYNILSFDELDDETRYVLSTTEIQYPLLESANLWDSWDKLCQLCLLHMYIDNENRVLVKYSI